MNYCYVPGEVGNQAQPLSRWHTISQVTLSLLPGTKTPFPINSDNTTIDYLEKQG